MVPYGTSHFGSVSFLLANLADDTAAELAKLQSDKGMPLTRRDRLWQSHNPYMIGLNPATIVPK